MSMQGMQGQSPNITDYGYLGQDKNLSSQDLASLNSIYNSWGDSSDAGNSQAIKELAGSKDSIAQQFGQLFESGTYNAESMHDVIWALNQDENTKNDSSKVQDAVNRTLQDPKVSAHDATEFENYYAAHTTI